MPMLLYSNEELTETPVKARKRLILMAFVTISHFIKKKNFANSPHQVGCKYFLSLGKSTGHVLVKKGWHFVRSVKFFFV